MQRCKTGVILQLLILFVDLAHQQAFHLAERESFANPRIFSAGWTDGFK
jgi:hypothetical protein